MELLFIFSFILLSLATHGSYLLHGANQSFRNNCLAISSLGQLALVVLALIISFRFHWWTGIVLLGISFVISLVVNFLKKVVYNNFWIIPIMILVGVVLGVLAYVKVFGNTFILWC